MASATAWIRMSLDLLWVHLRVRFRSFVVPVEDVHCGAQIEREIVLPLQCRELYLDRWHHVW